MDPKQFPFVEEKLGNTPGAVQDVPRSGIVQDVVLPPQLAVHLLPPAPLPLTVKAELKVQLNWQLRPPTL